MSTNRIAGSGGIELAVRLDGDPSAQPLVLLHALGETSNSWEPLLSEFARRYHVAAFDLRGHGGSDWSDTYSPALMCDDVVSAVDTLGFRRFTLIGHSLGGAIALLIAQQLGDRVTRLVIEDVVPPYPGEPRPLPERPQTELPFDWAMLLAIQAQLTPSDMRHWPALSTITAPTLVIAGGTTSHIPIERINEMVRLIPDCTIATIDVGHHVHRAAPDRFADTIFPWLAG